VILPAAGSSTRFGGGKSKLLAPLAGKPILRHSMAAFARRADVRLIVVATSGPLAKHIHASKSVVVCGGGTCRAGSVWNALKQLPQEIEWVAVHDAARPLVSQQLIDRTFAAAQEHGAAVPALPVSQTIKRANGPLPARSIETVPREKLWAVQTPQIARRRELLDAFENCPIPLEQVTDDVQLLELTGREVWLVQGEEANLKITTPIDMVLAEALIKELSPKN
jgi:2-C-methyl-D-erythritol 4-phosphate cytidylyltransferase